MSSKHKHLSARSVGISRSSLYYVSRKEESDWKTKTQVETVLREHPAYGSRRIAQTLACNRKKVSRIMRKYGVRPYRRRRTIRRKRKVKVVYANLLFTAQPTYPNHIWAADFTELSWSGTAVYVATTIDLYTREIVGIAVSLRKGSPLTLQALYGALLHRPRPVIFHSDNGREYEAKIFIETLTSINTRVSRSHPGCPWENGYQESFYGKFKLDLGDPNRFHSLGQLVAEIYRTIWKYNNTRIHSALKMPPRVFAETLLRDS